MRIDNLKINGFGKIVDKDINLDKNINIIYGKNETGKSTLLKFINCMFYGASKNKNGRDISDFDKYKPWKVEDFSGKIKYTLDDGNTYEVYREFKKKNPVIYNDKLQDISSEFQIDKTKGIDFILEQIGIDEVTFLNTVITYQDEIKMDKIAQNSIIQKISNIVSSGDESVSFKKTLDKINKMQNEQVGTERTTGRPINLVEKRIYELENSKEELENYKDLLLSSSDELDDIKEKLKIEENRLYLLKNIKQNLDKNEIKSKEIEINKGLISGYDDKISELEGKVDKKSKRIIEKEKKSFLKFYILDILFIILSIIGFIIKIPVLIPIIFIIISAIIIGITLININKFKKEKQSKIYEIDELEKRINQEIEILKQNKDEQILEVKSKENILNEELQKEKLLLKNQFSSKVDIEFLESALELKNDEISVSISNKEERINNLKLELHTKENQKITMNEKVEDLSKIQEELENNLQEKEEILSLNTSFNIAKECIESAYEKIRDSLSPEFTNKLCELISKISNNKYNNVKFSDTEGLTVEIDDGRYIPAERLSIGTIDQMYLALRLSSLNVISKENMPIILDESFAYFDDERLKNIIKFISEFYSDKQIIIFTCSNREKEVLKELDIRYNLIELES